MYLNQISIVKKLNYLQITHIIRIGMLSILNNNDIFYANIGPCLRQRDLCNFRTINRLARDNVDQVREVDYTKPLHYSIEQFFTLFPNAISINLSGKDITDADFVHLGQIQHLNISDCQNITDAAFEHIPRLKSLNMSLTKITDATLLKYKNSLESLNIDYCHNITDNGLMHLTKLKTLKMKACGLITDQAFANLENLEYLDMTYCSQEEITDDAFRNKNKLKGIRMLSCTQPIIGRYLTKGVHVRTNCSGEFHEPAHIIIMNFRNSMLLKKGVIINSFNFKIKD